MLLGSYIVVGMHACICHYSCHTLCHYFCSHYTETWNIQATTGDKPPALCGHTLTIMDGNKALLFAGVDDKNHKA